MNIIPDHLIEFFITYRCNYHCSYCTESGFAGVNAPTASDEVIDAFITLLGNYDAGTYIYLNGGEPTIHPRFFEVCEAICKNHQKLQFITNFSTPIDQFKSLIDMAGEQLDWVSMSLHLEHTSSDAFVDKILEFNDYKHPNTKFMASSVVKNENVVELMKVRDKLLEHDIYLLLQSLIENGAQTYKYSEETLKLLGRNVKPSKMQNDDDTPFGKICYTGHHSCIILSDGNIQRCYTNQPLHNLGNITSEYHLYNSVIPCLTDHCICGTKFDTYNLIQHETKEIKFAEYLINKGT